MCVWCRSRLGAELNADVPLAGKGPLKKASAAAGRSWLAAVLAGGGAADWGGAAPWVGAASSLPGVWGSAAKQSGSFALDADRAFRWWCSCLEAVIPLKTCCKHASPAGQDWAARRVWRACVLCRPFKPARSPSCLPDCMRPCT
jgi:hypothetical protein